ncbi:hypothetical protein JW859_14925, partial [bacterium]|nr:hypothetical protein [bacterium]
MSRTLRLAVLAQLVVFLVIFTGCGGSQPLSSTPDGNPSLSAESATETSWPSTLPADALQPWETRETSGVNADSILAAGIEWFDTSIAGVSDNHDASRMTSGDAGSKELSWATYRLRLQGTQPGVVSLDVNPLPKSDGTQSAYWVGLADYAAGCWEWHGPMSDNNVRFGTADAVADGADYLSDVGNLFVCVVAHDGAAFDVVCVGANPLDGDTTTPDAPANLVAAAVSGGLALTWDAMSAADLAGYRVYYCDEAFTLKDHPGVKTLDTLAGVA